MKRSSKHTTKYATAKKKDLLNQMFIIWEYYLQTGLRKEWYMRLNAFLKKKGIIVTVVVINFEHRYILWWDGQYEWASPNNCSSCPPINACTKLYEQESFDDISFENISEGNWLNKVIIR